jgi:hypothetical protein
VWQGAWHKFGPPPMEGILVLVMVKEILVLVMVEGCMVVGKYEKM